MGWSASLVSEPFDPERELADFLAGLGDEGGVVNFLGRARGLTKTGKAVESLFLDYHPRRTQASLDEIAGSAMERFEVSRVRVVHRHGTIRPGEPIVFVVAASTHRRAAFEAAVYLMDRLKTDAYFWKREDGPDGARWIEPTDADRSERGRWRD